MFGILIFTGLNQDRFAATGVVRTLDVFGAVTHHDRLAQINAVFFPGLINQPRFWFAAVTAIDLEVGADKYFIERHTLRRKQRHDMILASLEIVREQDWSIARIVSSGFDEAVVRRVAAIVQRLQKRIDLLSLAREVTRFIEGELDFRQEVRSTTLVVIATSIFFGFYLWGLDLVFSGILSLVLGR